MKRQRLLFSLLMAIVMMAFSPTGAWAVALELQEAPANVIELKAGDNNVVIDNPTTGEEWTDDRKNPEHYTMFMYKATGTGRLAIKGVGDIDTYGALFDANMVCLAENDAYTDDPNFGFFIDAKVGKVYYIGVRGYWNVEVGNYIINVVAPPPACASGEHVMTLHEGVAATCTTAGSKTYYECSKCNGTYADAQGTEVIFDIVIPALGHDFGEDGNCSHAGCDVKMVVKVLKTGDNNVVIENPTTGEEWSDDRKNPEHYTLFTYTVQADGDITFRSVGGNDTYCVLYDSSMEYLDCSDGNDENGYSDFVLVRNNVKAGEVYYLGARGYGHYVIGDYIICVEATLPECAPGEHELTLHEGVPATCTTAGTKAYYECSKCEHRYTDAAGTEEIADLVIPALGHDFGENGNCLHAGCDVKIVVKVLKTGDNNVVIENPTYGDEWDNDRVNPAHYTLFKYTVKADGDVIIKSVGDLDTYGTLYDASMNFIKYSDDGDGSNFKLVISDAKAGDVYYIGARGYSNAVVGNYIINVEAPLPECAPGEHDLMLHEAVAATCTTAGTKAYYECSKCEKMFADEEGTEEITDVIIPALGHDLDAEGKCQREGCDYKVQMLKNGSNSVEVKNPTSGDDWWNDMESIRHFVLFAYKVKADGDLKITISCDNDMVSWLYDSDMKAIDGGDNYASTNQFTKENVKAGELYYIGVRGYYDNQLNSCDINIDAPLPECAPGEHDLMLHEGVAATCTTAGTKAYYECGKCEKMFADAAGTEEITDVIIPALGHDLDADGKCQREGCDYIVNYSCVLVAGDNNVVIENPTLQNGDWWLDWDRDDGSHLAPRHYTLFRLVAEEDNDITIRSVGGEDTYGVLYDANLNLIKNADGNEDNFNDFKLVQKGAKAGEVYYVGARWFNDHAPAEYVINVTYAPVEDDGPVGPVDVYGDLMVNGKTIDLTDFEAVEAFNSENDGTIQIEGTIIASMPHYVLHLNNAEINVEANTDEEADGDMDKKPDAGIIYAGNVPLIVELTGKNTINIAGAAEETAVGIVAMSELMFTGSGSLDINCTDGTAPMFIGIEAKDMIAYDKQTASMFQIPMDLSFSGSININGKAQKVALGMGAANDMLLFSGEYNINTESAQNNIELDLSMMTTGIFAEGNIAFVDTKVKINSSKKGILIVGGDDDDDDDDDDDPNAEPPVYEAKKLMPMKSSRKAKAGSKSQSPLMAKAKAGKKKINVMGTPPCDFWVEGADVEIEAADGAISSLRQNPSWGPSVADGGTMHLTTGTSKENAETQDVIFSEDGCTDLFAETSGKNYVHIYETGEATMDVELFDGEEKRNDYLEIVVGHIEGCDTYSEMFLYYGPAYFNLTLHRTFKDDGWYTLCLPFDLDVESSPFCAAAHFAGIEYVSNPNSLGGSLNFGFNTVDKMHAGIPYLVKVDHEVLNPEFKNMKLVNYMPSYESHVAESAPVGPTPYVFNGCYDPVETFGHYFAGLGSGNMMKVIADGTKIRGFRGFFTESATYEQLVNGGIPGAGDPQAKAMTFTINGEIEGAATDIDPDLHVERNAEDGKTYNVMGQRVNKNAKGLIIRNGKTIFKK